MNDYRAGIVVFLFDTDGRILIGKRKGSHGAGTWSLPGGKLEFMEFAVLRVSIELEEETGLIVAPSRFTPMGWLDNIWVDPDKGQQHWITLFTRADYLLSAPPKVMEPDKCEVWEWVDPSSLLHTRDRRPLFHPLEQYLIQFPVSTWGRIYVRG